MCIRDRAGCINDADVPSGNGDNPISGANGGNMEISFVVPNSSNGSRAASAEDSGVCLLYTSFLSVAVDDFFLEVQCGELYPVGCR